ncbi:hypothetical protein HUJ05_000587 [Dendroctonus ponderosae]|nr:hypothetical protein HUJ05_000587 [Dendroctonus ponderosae]
MNQNFSALAIKKAYLKASKLFHSSSNNFANHYDTLKLQRNCTSQQIRDSFIRLSKKIHPDLNKSPNAHTNFLKVQEAYNVLSKPHLRASYDLELAHPGYRYESGRQWRYGPVYRKRQAGKVPSENVLLYSPWSFYRNRKTYQEYKSDMPRPKSGFVAMCVVAAVAMAFTVEILVVRFMLLRQQEFAQKRTADIQKILNEVEERAKANGLEAQLEIYQKQYEEMERLRTTGN